MAITINGSGTITGISAGGLPDGSVTAADLASGAITSGALPSGSIVQVVLGADTSETSTTSSSFVDTGLSATITPTSSSNKILVIVSHPATGVMTTTGNGNRVYLRLLRGSTAIHGMTNLGAYNGVTQRATETVTTAYLDTPATTSAITYKTQFANDNAGEAIKVNWNASVYSPNSQSTITLMEIAG